MTDTLIRVKNEIDQLAARKGRLLAELAEIDSKLRTFHSEVDTVSEAALHALHNTTPAVDS